MINPDAPMALPVPEEADLDDDAKGYFAKCMEKLGMVPNVLRAYASRPKKFGNFTRFYNELMLGDSGLSKLEREMIAVTVSSANHCHYCLTAHGQAVRKLSGDPRLGEMLAHNYRVAPLEPRQRAMLDFAWKLTTRPAEMVPEDRQALFDAGFTDDEVFDIADVAGFYNYSNRIAAGIDMMPNAQYHAMDR